MKPRHLFSATRLCFPLAAAIAALTSAPSASAVDFWWDGGTANWSVATAWSTTAAGTTSPAAFPASTTAADLFFNITSQNNAANTISMAGGDRLAKSLTFTTSGATNFRAGATNSVAASLTIGLGGITVNSGAGAVTIGQTPATYGTIGVILSGSQIWTNNSASTFAVNQEVGGSAAGVGLTKSGSGQIRLNGANTFTGAILVNEGILAIGNYAGLSNTSGITVSGGTAGLNLVQVGTGTTSNAINKTLSLHGFLRTTGGDPANRLNQTWDGDITVAGTSTIHNNGNSLFDINGQVDLGAHALTFQTDGTGSRIDGNIIGLGGSLLKTGTQSLILTGSNSYSGGTTVSVGKLIAQTNNAALGTSAVDVAASATLQLNNNLAANGTLAIANAVTGAGTLEITSTDAPGASDLNRTSTGALSSFTGNISVLANGNYLIGAIANVTTNQNLTIASGGYMTMGENTGFGKLDGSGTIFRNASANTKTLTLGNGDATGGNFSGTIRGESTSVNGLFNSLGVTAVAKVGTGTQILSGSNTYTGATTISAGRLVMGDAAADNFATTAVTVASNATLGGSGTIAGTVGVTGILAPGIAGVSGGIGTLATGEATWNGAATSAAETIWQFDLSANSNASDTLAITGDFKMNSTAGTVYQFNFMNSAPTTWGNVYTLVTWTGATDFTSASQFTWSNLGGAYDLQPGTGFTLHTNSLTFTAVPEPTTALAGLLLACGLLRRRRA